jgi:hypothetical protein
VKSNESINEEMLDRAKEHLARSFSVVGICERFEESLVVLAKTFNWEIPYYENRKVAKSRPKVDPREIEMIRENNRFDLELYDFGKELFQDLVRKNEAQVREGVAAIKAKARPGPWQAVYQSSVGAGRFIASKIASAT